MTETNNHSITTAEQLDALPAWSVVLDRQGDGWIKNQGGTWWHPSMPGLTSERLIAAWGPLTLRATAPDTDRHALERAAELLRERYEAIEAQADAESGDRFDTAADTIEALLAPDPEPKPVECTEWMLFTHNRNGDHDGEVMIPAWGLKDGDLLSTPDGWQPVGNVFAERDDYISFDLTGHRHVLTTFDTLVVRRG